VKNGELLKYLSVERFMSLFIAVSSAWSATTKPPIPSKRTKDSRDTTLIEIDYIAPDRADRYIPTL
jgi:hypothetical protein